MPKLSKTCQCGRVFTTYPSIDKEHCSRACSSRFKPRKPRTGVIAECEVCKKAFYRNPTEARKGRARFCSRACHNSGQTKVPVIKQCAWCGAEMRLKPSQARVRFCSREHEKLARIKRPQGWLHNGRPAKRDAAGYLMIWEPEHPNKSMKGWQYEHRLLVEKLLGRHLLSDEHVDHINRDKMDNRIENLQVLSQVEHAIKSSGEYRSDIAALRTKRDELQTELTEYRRRYGPLE